MLPEKGRLLEPKSASGQNARLRAGIEKETEGVTLVSTRHTSRQFTLHPYNFIGFSLRHSDHFIFSSTLLTLSSSDWTLSVRVPTRSVALTRGTPMSCSTSWHRRTAANTSSQSPSMFVPLACSAVFRPASLRTRSHSATYLDKDRPTPRGTTERSTSTFMRVPPNDPTPSSGRRHAVRQSPLRPYLSLIHISEPTRLGMISYAVFCLKKKKQ